MLDDLEARNAYATLAAFLAPLDDIRGDGAAATAIMCFGSRDLHVPITAAEIFHQGAADLVVCTGGVELLDGRPEADVFAAHLVTLGVPAHRIIVERESTHTHDNVVFGMEALRTAVPSTGGESVISVAWPFVARRGLATFALRYPDVAVRSVPAFCRPGEPAPFTVVTGGWAVDQLDRLGHYAARGDIAPVDVPAEVAAAAHHLRRVMAWHRADDPGGMSPSGARPGSAHGPGMHGVLEGAVDRG
ncbi:MAG: YdcF family protein [Ilumatobacter sp.]|nr:YdcF family protein [Ilumatobacter sp.]